MKRNQADVLQELVAVIVKAGSIQNASRVLDGIAGLSDEQKATVRACGEAMSKLMASRSKVADHSKVSPETAALIERLLAEGIAISAIASKAGVTRSSVWKRARAIEEAKQFSAITQAARENVWDLGEKGSASDKPAKGKKA